MGSKSLKQLPLLVAKLDDWFWRVIEKTLDALAMGLFCVVPGIFMAGGGLLIYQGVFWLKHGTWEPITVYDAVYELLPAPFIAWLLHPTAWFGLYKIVGYTLFCSLWWILIVLGALLAVPLFYFALVISDAASRLSHPTETTSQDVTSDT